ncbi:hypothetical protein M3221_14000 [Domibacillus indicus]|uniref:hypothetical protein n=1 Tax=Domibacillus indicus TaxID=1437523 RepID=UPI00203F3550|nr:hypothetical protein [Domibacillus indicus]MCM3789515.1 hypothetical protein [Domibacillus indicus]
MSFESRFVASLRDQYANDVKRKELTDRAVSFINDRVEKFGESVEDFIPATYGDIQVYSDYPEDELFSEIRIQGHVLGFKRDKNSIEVFKIIGEDRQRIDIISPLVSEGNWVCHEGGFFNEHKFDEYLKVVFEEVIS